MDSVFIFVNFNRPHAQHPRFTGVGAGVRVEDNNGIHLLRIVEYEWIDPDGRLGRFFHIPRYVIEAFLSLPTLQTNLYLFLHITG